MRIYENDPVKYGFFFPRRHTGFCINLYPLSFGVVFFRPIPKVSHLYRREINGEYFNEDPLERFYASDNLLKLGNWET